MRLHPHPYPQQQILLRRVLQIFVIIVVFVSKLSMEQAYNAIVQQAGQVHDVNIVSLLFNQF